MHFCLPNALPDLTRVDQAKERARLLGSRPGSTMTPSSQLSFVEDANCLAESSGATLFDGDHVKEVALHIFHFAGSLSPQLDSKLNPTYNLSDSGPAKWRSRACLHAWDCKPHWGQFIGCWRTQRQYTCNCTDCDDGRTGSEHRSCEMAAQA